MRDPLGLAFGNELLEERVRDLDTDFRQVGILEVAPPGRLRSMACRLVVRGVRLRFVLIVVVCRLVVGVRR